MSWLSSLISNPFGTVADTLVGNFGSISSAYGQQQANQQNKEIAEANRNFQERMSSTAYQRATSDMRKAGINPILAYKQGGASSPGGSTAVMGNVGAAAAQGNLASAQAQVQRQSAVKMQEEAATIVQTRGFNETLHKERWSRLFAQMGPENVLASAMAALNGVDIQSLLQGRDVNVTTRASLEGFLEMVRENNNVIRRELDGAIAAGEDIGRFWADLINEWMASND